MSLNETAKIVIEKVCAVKKGEKVLIVTNPSKDVSLISEALFKVAQDIGAEATMVVQDEKTLMDYADEKVIKALEKEPDVFFSISANKLGKDENAITSPYHDDDGTPFDHIFHYLMDGKKNLRAIWTPGITLGMFERAVCIDYEVLKKRCEKLMSTMKGAEKIHVTSPSGTDIIVPVLGRMPMADDGDFSFPGAGGNIPAGEVFISPLVGKGEGSGCQGLIVFDGSITLNAEDIIIGNPIFVQVKNGYVTSIQSKQAVSDGIITEADKLLETITQAEKKAIAMEKEGKLSQGQGVLYAKNARNIGELGIGLNPAALIEGNMLEDEKAFKTCHFAIGANYDDDAPSLIHLDGIVKNPTITIMYPDASSCVVVRDGELIE